MSYLIEMVNIVETGTFPAGFFFAVLGLELRAYTLSHSPSPQRVFSR
jgi:hypothetical protein